MSQRNLKNLLRILKGETVSLRRAEDDYRKKGDYDMAEIRKYQRWELENIIEICNNKERFDMFYKLYGEDAE